MFRIRISVESNLVVYTDIDRMEEDPITRQNISYKFHRLAETDKTAPFVIILSSKVTIRDVTDILDEAESLGLSGAKLLLCSTNGAGYFF